MHPQELLCRINSLEEEAKKETLQRGHHAFPPGWEPFLSIKTSPSISNASVDQIFRLYDVTRGNPDDRYLVNFNPTLMHKRHKMYQKDPLRYKSFRRMAADIISIEFLKPEHKCFEGNSEKAVISFLYPMSDGLKDHFTWFLQQVYQSPSLVLPELKFSTYDHHVATLKIPTCLEELHKVANYNLIYKIKPALHVTIADCCF